MVILKLTVDMMLFCLIGNRESPRWVGARENSGAVTAWRVASFSAFKIMGAGRSGRKPTSKSSVQPSVNSNIPTWRPVRVSTAATPQRSLG